MKMETRAHKRVGDDKGVSLVEMIIVMAIIMIVSAAAVMNISSALRVAAADSAAQLVVQEMRLARQYAISDRLVYRLTFNSPSGMTLEKQVTVTTTSSGVTTITTNYTTVSTDSVPSTVTFAKDTSAPLDYDGFGDGTSPIYFNGGNVIYFQPDGAGRDANNKICNGVVYTEIAGQITSSRSITLWGSTGRIKSYKLYAGTGGWYWK
jgi:prepilin-type N-terminal cleavage/methylation domain-containing protein